MASAVYGEMSKDEADAVVLAHWAEKKASGEI